MRPTSRRSCVGFVSHMFFHCHEMRLHCFLLSVAWFQLALISSDCFESFFQSVKYGSIVCRRKFHGKRIKFETFHQIMWSSSMGVVAMWGLVYSEALGSNSANNLLFPFFLFFFFFVLFCLLICFAVFLFLFLNIYLNNC